MPATARRNAQEPSEQLEISYEETALIIPVGTSFERWQEVAAAAQQQHRSMLFWLGDAFVYGEKHFGEKHAQAVEDYSKDTILTAIRVCERIDPPRRRKELHFSHHQVVCKFKDPKEQDRWLAAAVKGKWSRRVLVEEIAAEEKRQAEEERVRKFAEANDAPPEPTTLETEQKEPVEAEAEPAGNVLPFRQPEPVIVDVDHQDVIEHEEEEEVPPSPAEAAEMLRALPAIAMPPQAHQALRVILDERDLLLDVLRNAEEACANYTLPELEDAVKAVRNLALTAL